MGFRRARGLGATLIALGMLTTGLVVPASGMEITPEVAAQVRRASTDCTSGQMCFWSSTAYAGAVYGRGNTGTVTFGTARSLWNRTGKAVQVYSASGGGTSRCLAAGAKVSSTTLTTARITVLSTTTC